ncbi:hypothetical protein DPMN_108659 [Dreissena polymorpha]|uniref:Uncharacterized protein n=1 Tax=Dreissena polymorpha TaxID=45954 RepID=A0A9D4K979_DREPO|nr:hypothetical protein DPMN_108659 [Dreissena polymorpha]
MLLYPSSSKASTHQYCQYFVIVTVQPPRRDFTGTSIAVHEGKELQLCVEIVDTTCLS